MMTNNTTTNATVNNNTINGGMNMDNTINFNAQVEETAKEMAQQAKPILDRLNNILHAGLRASGFQTLANNVLEDMQCDSFSEMRTYIQAHFKETITKVELYGGKDTGVKVSALKDGESIVIEAVSGIYWLAQQAKAKLEALGVYVPEKSWIRLALEILKTFARCAIAIGKKALKVAGFAVANVAAGFGFIMKKVWGLIKRFFTFIKGKVQAFMAKKAEDELADDDLFEDDFDDFDFEEEI